MLSSRNEGDKYVSGRFLRHNQLALENYTNVAPWEQQYYDMLITQGQVGNQTTGMIHAQRYDPEHMKVPTSPTDWMTPEKIMDLRKNNPLCGEP